MDEVSDSFQEAFRAGFGTPVHACDFCGVTIFGSGDGVHFDEGELEDLRAKAKVQPDKYIEWSDCDGVSVGRINEKEFILGHKCPNQLRYEKFLWDERDAIIEYLKGRMHDEIAKVKQDANNMNHLLKKMQTLDRSKPHG